MFVARASASLNTGQMVIPRVKKRRRLPRQQAKSRFCTRVCL